MIHNITQTVTASSAYAAGNAVGGSFSLSDIDAGLGRSYGVAITDVVLIDPAAQAAVYDLLFFDSALAGTVTDKAAYTMHASDRAKCLGDLGLGGIKNYGTGIITLSNTYKRLSLPARSAYGVLVTRSTPTFTSDILLRITTERVNL